jgi:hypothetical protein
MEMILISRKYVHNSSHPLFVSSRLILCLEWVSFTCGSQAAPVAKGEAQ